MNRLAPGLASVLVVALALPGAGCINVNVGGFGDGELVESVVYGESGPKILMLDISGAITAEASAGAFGFGQRESLPARVRAQLDRGREDGVRALLLRIDSPGGTVTASEILYSEILRFKRETGVPVVAALMGTATSGAYYAAMAADALVAHPTTVTGSIGVVMTGLNLSRLMEKVGIENQTLTTGEFKDAGSPLRPMEADERAQLESVLHDLHARFVEVVRAGRPGLSAERVAELADGRVMSARQALEAGLVDEIAHLPGAVAIARKRAGLAAAQVVVYHRGGGTRSNLYSAPGLPEVAASPFARGFAPGAWLGTGGASFLYLWRPGALGALAPLGR